MLLISLTGVFGLLCLFSFDERLCICVYLPGTLAGQEQMTDPMDLELEKLVGPCVGAGNLTQVLCKSNGCS